MSEQSKPYNILPTPEEVDALLRGDYSKEEAAPENLPPLNSNQSAGSSEKVQELLEEAERVYRERVQRIQTEHARQIDKVGEQFLLIYLDLVHINKIAKMVIQFAASQSPEAIRTVASLIDYQSEDSLARIKEHIANNHLSQLLCDRNEPSSTKH